VKVREIKIFLADIGD